MSINKIIYTYNTYNGENLHQGFPSLSDFISFYKYTLSETYKYYNNIVIYTDKEGEDFLKINDIKYDIEVINFDKKKYVKEFTNYGKYVSISLQDEPFLHVDNDVIFKGAIPSKFMDSDILCEKRRYFHIKNKEEYDFIKPLTSDKIYSYNRLICSGILGGNNLDIFKERFELSKNVFYNLEEKVNFYKIIALEELLLTYLADIYHLKVKEIPSNKFIHFQGDKKSLLKDIKDFKKLKNKIFYL